MTTSHFSLATSMTSTMLVKHISTCSSSCLSDVWMRRLGRYTLRHLPRSPLYWEKWSGRQRPSRVARCTATLMGASMLRMIHGYLGCTTDAKRFQRATPSSSDTSSTFERSYARGVLTGDQDNIRQPLHESLEAAHTERKCEVAECPWISHQCPGTEDSRYAECPLLFTGNNTPPVPVSRLPGDIRIMLRLPHPPDLAPSTFGSSAPIPPSPYHPPFRRAIHATLRLSARHLPPITRQRTLPCR